MFFIALLMAMFVWCLKSIGPMWFKWSGGLGAPLVAGFIMGIYLGDMSYGLTFGATVSLVFIGVSVIGNAVPSDVCLAGYLGVTISMLSGTDPSVGVTVSATLGALGAVANPLIMTLNSFWVHRASKYVEKGDTKGVARIDVLGPVIFCFFLYFIPSFVIIYYGAPVLDSMLNAIPGWILTGIQVAGKLLPALGLAMLMNLLYKKSLIPFWIFGFVMSAYLGFGIIPVAITGVGFAILHYMYGHDKGSEVMNINLFAKNSESTEEKNYEKKLTRNDLVKSWLNWIHFGQTCYNYEVMQGMGFTHSMIPIINRLYEAPEEKSAALKRHIVYYNTENNWGSTICGIVASMEEEKANGADISDETINGIKTSLMGPLAGIGDTITQSLAKTIFLSVGCSLALAGNAFGPIFFILGMTAYAFAVSYLTYFTGYKSGKSFVTNMLRSGIIKNVSEALGALGMMVLGAMVASNINVTCPLVITLSQTAVVLQDVFDSILPKMVPVIIFFITYKAIAKGTKPVTVILWMFAAGIIGSLLNVLG